MANRKDDFSWTDAAEARLRELWLQVPKLSSAEIGRTMRLSKNAVVGKASRMALPPRDSPIRRRSEPRAAKPEPGTAIALPGLTSL